MTNLIDIEFEKTMCSYKKEQFSTRFTKQQVTDWLRSSTDDIDHWESQLGWYNNDGDVPESLHVGVDEFSEDKGDDDCPYDDEIQEWIDNQR